MQHKTVGQASYELLKKEPERINAIDMQREMQKSVDKELQEIILKHRSYADFYYIVYILRRERLIPNAIRQQFIVRKTRPKPDYDSSLFSYDNRTSELKFHWTIPDEETCQILLVNKSNLRDEEKELYDYVLRFSEGRLV